jgi:formylglycine-generating enzyme required for sulfatase activity
MTKQGILFSFIFLLLGIGNSLIANNISVSNVTLTGQNTTAGVNNAANFTQVQFNISWENSHRVAFGPTNWDAAWVFVKYRVAGGNWFHASLANTGQVAPTGSVVDIGLLTPGSTYNASTNPGLGAFIYRNAAGSGTFTANSVQMRWAYGANGVADNAVVEVQVFAIEMVLVPGGAFSAGDGGTSGFTLTTINTANATTAPVSNAGGYPTGQTAPAAASWPNGFSGFYCMKYEISQQQYVDFLNTLTASQSANRFPNSSSSRFTISASSGVYSTTNPFVACNFLSMADLAAYLDWSGLRPMTELEYEKACRGTLPAVNGEFAWGTTASTPATGLSNPGLTNEIASNTGANINSGGSGITGPCRVGMFAGTSTTRVQAGASFYGIMELSANLWERTITIANSQGRSFTGLHGNGTIGTSGDADVTNWPNATTGAGSGLRGGAWNEGSSISNRLRASQESSRVNSVGGRGVRSAP